MTPDTPKPPIHLERCDICGGRKWACECCTSPKPHAPTDVEQELRAEWWSNHGCPLSARYGDDGEMQCNAHGCFLDFKRMDLVLLRQEVQTRRLKSITAPSSTSACHGELTTPSGYVYHCELLAGHEGKCQNTPDGGAALIRWNTPASAETLEQRIAQLMQDIRFAPAEGGSEYDEARSRYGVFIRDHGQALTDALRRLQSTEHKLATWDKVGEAALQRITTLEARLQSTVQERDEAINRASLAEAYMAGMRAACGQPIVPLPEPYKKGRLNYEYQEGLLLARELLDVFARRTDRAQARAEALEQVITALQKDKSSEQDRRVAAQEAITQYWQPRAEAAEKQLCDLGESNGDNQCSGGSRPTGSD